MTKRIISGSMSTSAWFHVMGLISACALGIGFVAALISVGLSWKINREQSAEIERLKGDAATANKAAGEANQRAGELERSNLLLRRDVVLLELQLASPERSQAEFDSHMNDFLSDLDNEIAGRPVFSRAPSLSRRVLDPNVQRRKLNEECKRILIEQLGTEPKGSVAIVSAIDNTLPGEPSEFALEIAEALQSAGWRVENRGESPLIFPTIPPLILFDWRAQPTVGSELVRALHALALYPEVRQTDHLREQPPLLVVGLVR
jgi:hypothetical protein